MARALLVVGAVAAGVVLVLALGLIGLRGWSNRTCRRSPRRSRPASAREALVIGVRSIITAELTPADRAALRRLFVAAWPDGRFGDDDWDHAMGGRHWLLEIDGRVVSHASVVERAIRVGDRPLRTGYLEAVATDPEHERRGFGSRVVAEASRFIRDGFQLGVLSTGGPAFYERLGWRRWQGPTFVLTANGPVRTEDEDDGILFLLTPASPSVDPTAPLTCDWRTGDAW